MTKDRVIRLFVFVLLLLCGTGSGNQELFGPVHIGAEGPLSTEAAYFRRTDPKGEVKALVESMKADPSDRSLEGVRKLGEKCAAKAGEKAARVPDLPDSDLRKPFLGKKMGPVKFTDVTLNDAVIIYLHGKVGCSILIRSRGEGKILGDRLVSMDFKGGTVKDFLIALCEAADVVVKFEQFAVAIEARDAEPAQPIDQGEDFADPFR
jgi:hypothetical protein